MGHVRTGYLLAILSLLLGISVACGGGTGAPTGSTPAAKPPDQSSAAKTAPATSKVDSAPASKADSAPASKVDSAPGKAASPAASPVAVTGPKNTAWINQELLPLAQQEGKVVFYTAAELGTAEAVGRAFRAATGIEVEIVRSGGERLYSRIAQERQANQHLVDVFHTSVDGHMLEYKEQGILEPYKIVEDAKYQAQFKDPDGMYYTTFMARSLPAYNSSIVSAEEAPKNWQDLLDPKWKGKLAHSHPAYSGTTLTAMVAISELYGWEYYEELAKNEPLIVQSALEPLPLLISGERPVAALINGDAALTDKLKGNPVEVIYPEDGISVAPLPSGIFKDAPHPNAAKVFQDFLHSQEGQQIWADGQLYISARDDVTYPEGVKKLNEIKYILLDSKLVNEKREEVKEKFKDIFGA